MTRVEGHRGPTGSGLAKALRAGGRGSCRAGGQGSAGASPSSAEDPVSTWTEFFPPRPGFAGERGKRRNRVRLLRGRVMTKREATLSLVGRTIRAARPPATDRQLLRQFAGGDQDAFAALVRR